MNFFVNCGSEDFLEIRTGENESAPLLGTYCGTDPLPPIESRDGFFLNLTIETGHYENTSQIVAEYEFRIVIPGLLKALVIY